MKDDPFSQLAGLDQRLFQEERAKKTTKQRHNETTGAHTSERDNVVSGKQAKERKNEPTRTPVSPRSGHTIRMVERHSHDIFQDQVRWINRVKLDIEEAYGQRITGNQLVQLAVDSLHEDYKLNGEKSRLIRVLVLRQLPEQDRGSG